MFRKSLSDSTKQVEDASKNEDEWRSLTDLLQSQLDHKSEQQADLETELASIKYEEPFKKKFILRGGGANLLTAKKIKVSFVGDNFF